jgi:hypothetical protein
VIPALRRLRQEEQEFQASLGCIVELCLKNRNKKKEEACTTSSRKHFQVSWP